MRTEHTQRSKFDRALEALEELDRVLGLTVEQRVELERRLLESVPVERREPVRLRA